MKKSVSKKIVRSDDTKVRDAKYALGVVRQRIQAAEEEIKVWKIAERGITQWLSRKRGQAGMTERQKFIIDLRKQGRSLKAIEEEYQERFAAKTSRSKIINVLAQFGYWY